MKVNNEEVLRMAKLASLKIKDEEVENYAKDLENILNYANIINNVKDLNERDIITNVNTKCNVFRKDEIVDFKDKEELLKNAPELENNMFKIPNVI